MKIFNLFAGSALVGLLSSATARAQSSAAPRRHSLRGRGGQWRRASARDDADIIVTATRRETTLQKTPIAISAFSQATLDRQQVTDVTDLAQFVPSLHSTSRATSRRSR